MKDRVRIINKTKDSVVLDFKENGGKSTYSWDSFNKMFNIVDKVWAVPSESYLAKIAAAEAHISKALETLRQSKDTKVDLGSSEEIAKIQEILGVSQAQAISLVESRLSRLERIREKKYKRLEKREQKEKPTSAPEKKATGRGRIITTFGDLPELQKLKKNYEGKKRN